MPTRTISAMAAALLLVACSGAKHQLPAVTQQEISAVDAEILSEPDLERRRMMSEMEASATLAAVVKRIHPVAQQLCHELRVGNCRWRYQMLRDRSLNAGAGVDGSVFLNRGLAELTANDDEIALVIAHELGHHIADHPRNGDNNTRAGALLGGLLGAALDAAAAAGGGRTNGGFTQIGTYLGAKTGRLSYSKEQEREADYLAVVIAYRAGVDLDRARGVMMTMARSSGKRESGMFDSHPEGAERLASYDRAVAEVRAARGALPPRKD